MTDQFENRIRLPLGRLAASISARVRAGFSARPAGVCALALVLTGQTVGATELTFQFNLPSFGGNPASASYYLNLLEQQKFNFATEPPPSDAELFEDQLRRRIIAAVSAQVVSSIYEGSFTTGDSFTVGDFTVLYIDPIVAGNVCVEINDGISTTQVCVPAP